MIHVLEIGKVHDSRRSDDLLAYLPSFRPFFDQLPQRKSGMRLKALMIPFNDIESVTQTIIKVSLSHYNYE